MADPATYTPQQLDAGRQLRDLGSKWIERIERSATLEKDFLDDAAAATQVYLGKSDPSLTGLAGEDSSVAGYGLEYNILFSNTETIVPAVINGQPRPDVRQRYGDKDDTGRTVAEVIERAIGWNVDNGSLQSEVEKLAQDGFLAGRGILRLRFYKDAPGGEPTKDELQQLFDQATGGKPDAGSSAAPGNDNAPPAAPNLGYQPPVDPAALAGGTALQQPGMAAAAPAPGPQMPPLAPLGQVPASYERMEFEAVSWRDFRHGPATRWCDIPWIAFRQKMSGEDAEDFGDAGLIGAQTQGEPTDGSAGKDEEDDYWEVWVKRDRRVLFIRQRDKTVVKQFADPFNLSKFFPIADPVQPIEINGRLMPVVPYTIYRKLAEEMDSLTKRIRVLTKGLKARGLVLGKMAEIQKIAELGDNELAAVEDIESFAADAGGLANAVLWWPIDKIIAVIQQLIPLRDQTKAAIYEITGISDIIRGQSVASETATAQQIKSQWGSLRIQKMQRQIERAVRDIFQMMSEIIPALFSPQRLQQITGIEITPDMAALMRDQLSTSYRVDVESNSTVQEDVTARKGELSTFLTGAAQYFQAVAPMVQNGALPKDVAIGVFVAVSRSFKLGKSIEDLLEGMLSDAQGAPAATPGAPGGQPDPNAPPDPNAAPPVDPAQQAAAAKAAQDQQEGMARLSAATAKAKSTAFEAAISAHIGMTRLAAERAKTQAQHPGIALHPINDLEQALPMFNVEGMFAPPQQPQPDPGAPLQ